MAKQRREGSQSEYDLVAKAIEDMFKKKDPRSGATCIAREGERANEWELVCTVFKDGRKYRTSFFVNKNVFKKDRKMVEEAIDIIYNRIDKHGVQVR